MLRTFCPLKLSFAKTIDTFQGQTAGPVDEGKPPNPVKTVICDPGLREFEAQKPGLFYSIISRGTKMGTLENGKRSGSAIYFYDYGFGSVMTPAQINKLKGITENKPDICHYQKKRYMGESSTEKQSARTQRR
jgi:hypothetical protein